VGPEIDVPTSDSTRGDAHSCDLRVGRDSGKPACSPCKYKRRMSTIARDLTRSAVDAVVGARTALGWSQRRLALVAGVSQTFVSRFERGAAETVTVESVGRMFDALGIRAELRTELPILGGQRRQADVVHAWTCGYVGRRLAGEGWDVRHEVEVGTGRFRGWIDVLGYRPTDRSLVINECKTDILDVGAIQRTTNWYQREAWVAARRFGWRPGPSRRSPAAARQRGGGGTPPDESACARGVVSGSSGPAHPLVQAAWSASGRQLPGPDRSGLARTALASAVTSGRPKVPESLRQLRGRSRPPASSASVSHW